MYICALTIDCGRTIQCPLDDLRSFQATRTDCIYCLGQLLHHAVWRPQADRLAIVQYILQRGAEINAIMYCDHKESFTHQEPFGIGTALHEAAAAGDLGVIRLLLDQGADCYIKDTRGRLAWERAQQEGHTGAADLLKCYMLPV